MPVKILLSNGGNPEAYSYAEASGAKLEITSTVT